MCFVMVFRHRLTIFLSRDCVKCSNAPLTKAQTLPTKMDRILYTNSTADNRIYSRNLNKYIHGNCKMCTSYPSYYHYLTAHPCVCHT